MESIPLTKNLLEAEISRLESIPVLDGDERLLLSLARREYEIIKRISIGIADLAGTREELTERLKDKSIILIDPEKYGEIIRKAKKFDRIMQIAEESE